MNKLKLILILLVVPFLSKAQYPINQSIGADSTLITSKGGLKGRFVNFTYLDTAFANLERIKQYPGAQIFTTRDNNLWVRDSAAKKWMPAGGIKTIPTLQQVTDAGDSTSHNIYFGDGSGPRTKLSKGGGDLYVGGDSAFLVFTPSSKEVEINSVSTSKGLIGNYDFSSNADSLSYIQKGYVKTNDNLRLKISDTLSMLSPYLRKADTTGKFVSSVSAISPITSIGTSTPIISTSMSTNKLIGRYSTGAGVMQEVSVGDGLNLTGTGILNNTATPTPIGYYGAFQDILTQTLSTPNVGQPFLIRTIDESNQVIITQNGSGQYTRITPLNTGVYNIQWSGQFQNTDNAIHDVNVWFRKGLVSSSGPGTDIEGSNGIVAMPARKSATEGDQGHVVAGWNFLLSIVAGEYVEFYWMSNSTQITLQAYSAGNPPPSTASLIVTVTQQSGIMAGTGITALNSLTGSAQTLITGIDSSDFNIVSTGLVHKFNLPTASSTKRGALSSTDWSTFNNKLNTSDTNSLSGRINLKLNISDTAAMLTPYLRYVDTTGKFITSLFRKTATDSVFFVKGGANTFAFKDSAGGANIYNQNGSLTGNRTLTLNSQPLTFLGTTRTRFFANGRMTIGDTTDAGFRLDVRGEDASINGLRIGKGNGQLATNTVLGLNTLTANSGNYHIAIGVNALAANTTGNANIGIGYNALKTATIKSDQIAIGYEALGLANSEASIGIGSNALRVATGINNVAIGLDALKANTSGNNNTVMGWNSSFLNTIGTGNTVMGAYTYRSNVSNGGSTLMGYAAGKSGNYNTGIGSESITNSTGDNNTAIGRQSGYFITAGMGNICIGANAGQYLTTQNNHIVISSLNNNTLAEDQARAAFYVQQNITTASQKITMNGVVGVNTITPAASSILDLTSTTKGFLPPRMTTTQINAISTPALGLVVYNTTLNVLCVYTGTWQKMTTTAM